jgi:hypothetical protein
MQKATSPFILVIIFCLHGCGPSPSTAETPLVLTPASRSPTAANALATPIPPGETITITSAADSGLGTLRQALQDAQPGDIITFDSIVFPSDAPVTIYPDNELPPIIQGHLTINASEAGVILDGRNITGEFVPGLQIVSDGNTIQGLQVINFSGAGIVLSGGAQKNTIGGDRGIGSGPLGRGNLSSGNTMGIGIWDEGTAFNVITGNLVGSDITEMDVRGNSGWGIYISEGACYNTIGPNNIVSYNGEAGIQIYNPNSVGNTITQNHIHQNGILGIQLKDGGNMELAAPSIFDFDMNAGTLMGSGCANCTIEIFSDSKNEGEYYEGRTVADSNGTFMFDIDTSFTGLHLTATATDTDGNTSPFSSPTSGMRASLILQVGNDLPRTQLRNKRSGELEDNRIGSQWDSLAQFDLSGIIDSEIFGLGLKRVRLAANGISWDHIDWDIPELTIDPSVDDLLSTIAKNEVTITYVLSFWDKAGEQGENCPRFTTEDEIQRYIDFVRFIVLRFKDRVQYFEIWNEPDIGECVQHIKVDDYINLVMRVMSVLDQEHPEVKVKVGGTINPRETENRNYLFSILSSDIMPLVDAISWHMGPSVSPEYEYWRAYYYEYPSLVQEIKDVASANGFTGEYIADELTWWTAESVPVYEQYMGTYSELVSAKYYARGILLNLGMDISVGVGGSSPDRMISFSTVRNLCTIMAGAMPITLPMEIQSDATNITRYTFSLSNGDYLVALWADGVAVEDDPGISTKLTFPGLSGEEAIGIDVLYGFEQQLIVESEDGNLVLRDLLVKDYPIILRLINSVYP